MNHFVQKNDYLPKSGKESGGHSDLHLLHFESRETAQQVGMFRCLVERPVAG